LSELLGLGPPSQPAPKASQTVDKKAAEVSDIRRETMLRFRVTDVVEIGLSVRY
jgi:hypothetical protein